MVQRFNSNSIKLTKYGQIVVRILVHKFECREDEFDMISFEMRRENSEALQTHPPLFES